MARADDEARVCFNIDRKLYNEMIEALPWGMREQILTAMLKLTIEASKKYGPAVLGMIVADQLELKPTKAAIQILNNGG